MPRAYYNGSHAKYKLRTNVIQIDALLLDHELNRVVDGPLAMFAAE